MTAHSAEHINGNALPIIDIAALRNGDAGAVRNAPLRWTRSTRTLMIIGALARRRADIGAEIAMDLPVAVPLAV